jgi:hypothetical protein
VHAPRGVPPAGVEKLIKFKVVAGAVWCALMFRFTCARGTSAHCFRKVSAAQVVAKLICHDLVLPNYRNNDCGDPLPEDGTASMASQIHHIKRHTSATGEINGKRYDRIRAAKQ